MDFLTVKKDIIKKVIERGKKKVSKKTQNRAHGQGFRNSPEDCCIISSCRHFLKAKVKSDINLDFCDCRPGIKIPASRIPFFQSQLFDRGTQNIINIIDLPPIEDSIEGNIYKFFLIETSLTIL